MANTAQTESNNIKQKIYNITQDTHDYTPQIHNVKQEINNITIEANSYRICTQEQLEYLAFVDKHPELLQNKISSANPKQLKKLWEELAGNLNSMAVGNVDEEGRYLLKTTEECLNECINLCRPNVEFNAKTIFPVPCSGWYDVKGNTIIDKKSIAFAITKQQSKRVIPILTFGGPEVEIEKNGWTATTLDGARTAQFDHTILITETGAEVLTKPS
uniref:Peptidase M24 domain-containing protein n=1 Tax=Glossina palpalis gambiensis TaxID=67801 RepID=A0A1B0BZX9_9MUSC